MALGGAAGTALRARWPLTLTVAHPREQQREHHQEAIRAFPQDRSSVRHPVGYRPENARCPLNAETLTQTAKNRRDCLYPSRVNSRTASATLRIAGGRDCAGISIRTQRSECDDNVSPADHDIGPVPISTSCCIGRIVRPEAHTGRREYPSVIISADLWIIGHHRRNRTQYQCV